MCESQCVNVIVRQPLCAASVSAYESLCVNWKAQVHLSLTEFMSENMFVETVCVPEPKCDHE